MKSWADAKFREALHHLSLINERSEAGGVRPHQRLTDELIGLRLARQLWLLLLTHG
jgi:hypothetical protein